MCDSEVENAVVPHWYRLAHMGEKAEIMTLERIFNPQTLQIERIPGVNYKCEGSTDCQKKHFFEVY